MGKGLEDTLWKNFKKGLIEMFKYFSFSNSGKHKLKRDTIFIYTISTD